jgi:hypothetical protein
MRWPLATTAAALLALFGVRAQAITPACPTPVAFTLPSCTAPTALPITTCQIPLTNLLPAASGFWTTGYSVPGDGGAGLYVPAGTGCTQSAATGLFKDTNNNCWQLTTLAAVPEQFGATFVGTPDDSIPIQNAIDYMCNNHNGGVVQLSPEQYPYTTTLEMPGGIRLEGATQGSNANGFVSALSYSGTGYAIEAAGSDTYIIYHDAIERLEVYAPNTTIGVINITCWNMGLIRQDWIIAASSSNRSGIYSTSCGGSDVTQASNVISENYIGLVYYGITLAGYTTQTVIEKNRVQPNCALNNAMPPTCNGTAGGSAVFMSSAQAGYPNRISVRDNDFETSSPAVNGVNILGSASGILISGNRFELSGGGTNGVEVGASVTNVVLSGNYYSGVTVDLADSSGLVYGWDQALPFVSCSGSPTAAFKATNGRVTHC